MSEATDRVFSMLQTLRLKNFAVVEEAEVSFGAGLTVLTGETGAGKSILIDALALLAGGRAGGDVIRAGAEEASVEGLFECPPALRERLEVQGLPVEGDELLIRRTMGRQGRGRAYVNGALVNVAGLARLMKGQLDIAGQHEHMALFDDAQHLSFVDRFGEVPEGEVFTRWRAAWDALREVNAKLDALGGDEAQVAARIDYLKFQLEEIDRVAPTPGEDVALETERRRLASAVKLRALAGAAEEAVSTKEESASELLGRALALLGDGEKLDASLASVRAALVTAQAELDDAARALSRYLSGLESDPRRLDELEDRLDALRRLTRKHAAPLEGVLAKRASLAEELDALLHRAERRAEVEAERTTALADARRAAAALTVERQRAAVKLQQAVMSGLSRLSMAHARFSVELAEGPLGATGADALRFLFCANPGEALRPLEKVASGGEASRVMLAMKAALAGSDAALCSVFDEADAGIGGAVADVVGRLIKDIASHRQVLCITHLPQVAAHARAHLKIEKGELKGRTRSTVHALAPGEARTRELARMLSGIEVTREALAAAEALTRSAQRRIKPVAARERRIAAGE